MASATLSPERAMLEAQLLRTWRSAELWLKVAAGRSLADAADDDESGLATAAVTDEQLRELVDRWVVLFREELEVLRTTRNAIVHARTISDDDVRDAVHLGQQVIALLTRRLSELVSGGPPHTNL